MEVRRIEEPDEARELFYETIYAVNSADYAPSQLEAWSASYWERTRWEKKIQEDYFIGVFEKNILKGFASLSSDGTVDLLFVHKNCQRKGIGSKLMQALEVQARTVYNQSRLRADVSITARVFFERKGFAIEKMYTKEVRGVLFENTLMYKEIGNVD